MKLLQFAKSPRRILFVGAEAAPFVKVGGLASVMDSLPRALRDRGCDARVMIPKYLSIEEKYGLSLAHKGLNVPTGNSAGPTHLVCNVKIFEPKGPKEPVTTYFLENQEYYEQRSNVYGYADDAVRWALLCRGAIEFFRLSKDWVPDVIVACDWQAALLVNYLKTEYKSNPQVNGIATVYAIHNLYYQGMFDHRFIQEMDYDDGRSPVPAFEDPRLAKINCMRRGIIHADMVTTVSPTYAKEILTPDYGELLDTLLRERRNVLTGILNGIDYAVWDPKRDPYIVHKYDKDSLSVRAKNKAVLQERFGLEKDKGSFLIGIASRLTKQKGFELLYPIFETLMRELPIQLAVVGSGDAEVMGFFHGLETKYPGRVAAHLSFDAILPHLIFAGADAVLVPSQFEPCGLVQMEAMRMGAVPIARRTGGLADSVQDYDAEDDSGTGFTFEKYDSSSLMIALIRAYENFKDKKEWAKISRRAMESDFSWDTSAEKYLEVFERALSLRQRELEKESE
ncbi:MAG TPA: glycogen/starch synthase [Candidatus Paceibacterota bacterium]|nr:glycogen/starch synthase [Candidatus Paceibacterota bacterium]